MPLSNQKQEKIKLCNRVKDSALSKNVLHSVKKAYYQQSVTLSESQENLTRAENCIISEVHGPLDMT